MHLFFIPFSGGNSYSYMFFKKYLLGHIRIFNLELPGHGLRVAEPLLHSIEEMTDDLFRQIQPNINDEYAIFGHSLGALLAFTLCQKILKSGEKSPKRLFISGQTAPSLIEADDRYLMPNEQFIEVIREMKGTPEELLCEQSFLDFFLPIIRADFMAIANYKYEPDITIDVPITVLIGIKENISAKDAALWQKETIKEVEVKWFEGGHFFIHEKTDEICRLIKDRCFLITKT